MIRKITLVFIAACCIIATNTFAQNASRMIARHTIRFDNVWAPYDSANFYYSAGRGGDIYDLYNSRLAFDSCKFVGWDGSAWQPYMDHIQTISTWGLILDKTQLYTGTNDKKTIYNRDGNGNILEELSQDWNNNSWENQNRVLCTYDGNNNLLSQEYETWVSNAWVKSFLYIYYYDGNNNMIANKSAWWNAGTSQYDSANHNVFYYNTNNQVDSSFYYSWNSGWQLGNRTVSYYDGNNVNIGYLSQNWVNNAWENNLQSFTLFDQNNIPCGDSVQNWLLYNNTWRNFSRGKSTFDMNGNAVEYLYQKWDTGFAAFINDYIDSVTYNSYDQPTWNKRQGWDTTNQMWVGRYAFTENRYYYELYTAAVKDMKKTGSELKLYPVPARSNINVHVNWSKPQDFTVAVYDIQGRLLKQWGEKACREYKINMLLQGLPPGNYVLKLRGKEEHLEKRFVIAE